MLFEVLHDHRNDSYIVDWYDMDSEGERYCTVFEGLKAKARAEEYADMKNKQYCPLEKSTSNRDEWDNSHSDGN